MLFSMIMAIGKAAASRFMTFVKSIESGRSSNEWVIPRLTGSRERPTEEMAKLASILVPTAGAELLSTFQTAKLIDDWKKRLGIDISSELKDIEQISLYRCEASHLDFFMPSSAVGSGELYLHLQQFDWFYMRDKWEFDQALRDLKGSQRILEVGSGPGFFMERLLKECTGSLIKGLELSAGAFQEALRKKLPVEQMDLQEFAAKGETFDAVCSFQVLEHVAQPRQFLESMTKILSNSPQPHPNVPKAAFTIPPNHRPQPPPALTTP